MAVRISGVTIPGNKRAIISLTYIFGIGPTTSLRILEQAQIDPSTRIQDLKEDDVNKLRTIIEKEHITEGDLRREVVSNIKRLKEIGCYRGTRHTKGLPVNGQRTKTNSRSVRGNKKGVGSSGKKPTAQKT